MSNQPSNKSQQGVMPFDTTSDPDQDLIAQAKQELPYRTASYEVLMRRHEKILYKVCFRILGNEDDANDACQDVMVKAFHGLIKFESRSTFKTWLLTIAHNTCYSLIKKLKRSREFSDFLKNDPITATEESIETDKMDIEKVLMALDPKDREILTLRFVAELQFDEIAEICNLGLSATKMRIYRATETLKSLYQQ